MDIDQISFGIKASAGNASTSLERLVQSLDKLNDAFVRVQTSGTGAIATLNGIVSASSGIKTGLKGASASAKTTSTAMKQVTATTGQTSNSLNTMHSRLKTVGSALAGVNRNTKNATGGLGRFIQKITQISFVVYVARRALSAFGQGIQSSIDYVENLNLFMVALGENTTRATGFIKEMSESLYLDEAQLTRVQGLFYQISEALGLGSEKAYTLSENFTKLAYDLASFYNITIEDAVVKLQAGLVGETEPLRRIGIIITENNLAETARNLGIKKSIRNMTEMEKIQLRYVTALQQTQNAHGDMARTLEQPENLLRILKEQFQVLMRELGNVSIGIIKDVIPQVIGLTIALGDLARQMAKTLGYEAPEIRDDLGGYTKTVAKESEDIENSTDKTQKNWAKILKYTRDTASTMTGIDELNVLSDDESGFAGMSVDDLFPSADEMRDQIDLGIEKYNNNMEASKDLFADIIQQWKDLFAEIGRVFESTKTAVKGLWEEVFGGTEGSEGDKLKGLRIMNAVLTGIVTGVTDVVRLFKELYNDALLPILRLVVPDVVKDLEKGESGSIATVVAFLTKAFLIWQTIKVATSLITTLSHLVTLGGLVGGPKGLLALFAVMGTIELGFDLKEAITTGQWEEFGKNLIKALLLGLGVGFVTGSGLLACITIPIAYSLLNSPPDPTSEEYRHRLKPNHSIGGLRGRITELLEETKGKKQEGLWERISDFASIEENANLMLFELRGTPMSARDIENAFKRLGYRGVELVPPKLPQTPSLSEFPSGGPNHFDLLPFAKGGTPEKGNLFIAGEKGPELVTEHNGETVVMNEKQLAERGVSFYADGVNAPEKKGFFNELNNSDMGIDLSNIIKGVRKGFGEVVDELKDKFGSLGDIMDTTYNGFKNLAKFGVGVLLNAFNKFADSKSFQTLFKSAPAEGGTTTQQQKAMGDIIGTTLGDGSAGQIFALAQHIADGTVGKFLESAPMMIDAGMDFLMNLLDGVVKALPAILQALPEIIRKMVEVLSNPETIKTIIQAIISVVGAIVVALPDIISALVMAIPTVITALIGALMDFVMDGNTWKMLAKIGANLAIGIAQGMANLLISALNLLISVAELPFRWAGVRFPRIPEADFSGLMFAEGGFPNEGQMFIAREAGAELVGNIGGNTAVANNDQIVTAVSDGVYRAVSMAMSEQGGQRVSLRVDGRRMSEAMDLASKKRGLAFGTGGY